MLSSQIFSVNFLSLSHHLECTGCDTCDDVIDWLPYNITNNITVYISRDNLISKYLIREGGGYIKGGKSKFEVEWHHTVWCV